MKGKGKTLEKEMEFLLLFLNNLFFQVGRSGCTGTTIREKE